MNETKGQSASIQEYQPDFVLTAEDCEPYVGREEVEDFKRLAGQVEGRTWANTNRMLWFLELLHYQMERDRVRLKDLCERDSLTGLLNRRSF